MRRTFVISLFCALAVAAFIPRAAQATDFFLSDLNSNVRVHPDDGGMRDWSVDGVDHLHRQWFWYRVGNTGPESQISGLFTSGNQPNARTLNLLFTGPGFTIEVSYLLTGGTFGSNRSSIAEEIRIINTGTADLDFHFFQYTDFNILDEGLDTITHVNDNTFHQKDRGFIAAETVTTPTPDHWEADVHPNILNRLNDAFPTTLSDSTSPAGPFNGEFAWQWDFVLRPGDSFLISKNKLITPEPASLIALGTGLVGLLGLRRRRK